ncbi:MAG: N-formylglutamate amidohydrolase [Kofleriaceae bacterium]
MILAEGAGPIIGTAIHDGHELRVECAAALALDDATRLREEDPYTARVAKVAPTHLIATRSRFEVDLNRPRDRAVYLTPDDAWGLKVWRQPPDSAMVASSLAGYDAFYATLERLLRARERFVVLDIHSYNHRRDGRTADPEANPEINLGTAWLDRARWGGLIDRFTRDLVAASPSDHRLDVRENVKFKGGEMNQWIHRTFEHGCCLSIELKKTFMDETTGELDEAHLAELARAIEAALPGLAASL